MKNYTPSYIKQTLKERELAPLKKFGQNFLIDDNALNRIEATVPAGVPVIEIGAGLGALTARLASGREVLTYEIDQGLYGILSETFSGQENVHLIHADAMKRDFAKDAAEYLGTTDVFVCANLPYYITTPLIMGFLESGLTLRGMTLMMQKEVAKRLVSSPASSDYGAITAAVGYFAEAKTLFNVSAGCFYPAPDVDSAVVGFCMKSYDAALTQSYLNCVKMMFAQRRKTLLNNMQNAGIDRAAAVRILDAAGVEAARRAESLSTEEFIGIARLLGGE